MEALPLAHPGLRRTSPLHARDATTSDTSTLPLRQLRHHTKNALQRILNQVECSALRGTAAGAVLADDVQRRIMLSAAISDALFGITSTPDSIEHRLEWLTRATVDLLASDMQTIHTEVEVVGRCSHELVPVVLQVVHEMLGNAVKHGMHMRLLGHIVVRLRAEPNRGVTLEVSDDGWGPGDAEMGEGRSIMAGLAAPHGGTVCLRRNADWTVAALSLPGATRLQRISPVANCARQVVSEA